VFKIGLAYIIAKRYIKTYKNLKKTYKEKTVAQPQIPRVAKLTHFTGTGNHWIRLSCRE